MKRIAMALAICCVAHTAYADADYDLFNPVPDDKLRPFVTERPSRSDGAFTVDAGHYQIETSLLSYSYDDSCVAGTCGKGHEWDLGAGTTIRVGLTQSAEFQVLFDAYRNVTLSDKTNETSTHQSGFGDTTLRYKYSLWGDDGGTTALAGMVFVKLPTNADQLGNDAVEGGIEFPFNITLPDDWSISGMTQVGFYDEDASTARSYYEGYTNSIILGKAFDEETSGYAEFYTFLPDTGTRNWQNTLDFGVTHLVSSSVQLDASLNLGVTEAAPDAQLVAGISFRY